MEIYRKTLLRTNISIQEAKSNSAVFSMTEDDIENDSRICDIIFLSDDSETLITFQNIDVERDETYCYIHLKEHVGLDGSTKVIQIRTIVIEETFIETDFIRIILNIILKQNNFNNEYTYRIFMGQKYYRLDYDFSKHILEIAKDIVDLYQQFTNKDVKHYYLRDVTLK